MPPGAVAVKVDVVPEQIPLIPDAVGATGLVVIATDIELAVLVPQELPAVTLILPDEPPNVTVTDVVPEPAVIEAPDGTVQLYEIAPDTADIENTFPALPEQTDADPDITPG